MACKAGLRDSSPQLRSQTAAACVAILVCLRTSAAPVFTGERCCLLAACCPPLWLPRNGTLLPAAPPDRQDQE